MLTAEQIEEAISPLMPAEQRAQAPELARLLADLSAGARSPEEARAALADRPALAMALGALGGQQVSSDSTVLTFGAGGQLGDVSLRDVAGGNIVTISLPAQPPRRQQIDERRTYGCLGLPILSITSSRTIVTLALTIFLSGAVLGGLITGGLAAQSLPATPTSMAVTDLAPATETPGVDATLMASTVEAAVAQTVSALSTATAATAPLTPP